MRAVLISDLIAVARVLRAAQPPDRPTLCQRIIEAAETADEYTRLMGRWHPVWGSGSLKSAASRHEQMWDWPVGEFEFLSCLALVLDLLVRHKAALRDGADRGDDPLA